MESCLSDFGKSIINFGNFQIDKCTVTAPTLDFIHWNHKFLTPPAHSGEFCPFCGKKSRNFLLTKWQLWILIMTLRNVNKHVLRGFFVLLVLFEIFHLQVVKKSHFCKLGSFTCELKFLLKFKAVWEKKLQVVARKVISNQKFR